MTKRFNMKGLPVRTECISRCKSTLAKLLLGFCQPTEGQIRNDSIDIRHLGANELRGVFGVVPQDVTLFGGAILDDLRAADPEATLPQVPQAAKMAGMQMELQLRKRYADYLAAFLQSGFHTKQVGNTYNVVANTVEQLMTLGVLMLGAWTVMTEPSFTIGMLVAFQMFSGKLSQPVLRIVGLWTQFQRARLAVDRLGDLMNVPTEPHTATPRRGDQAKARGRIGWADSRVIRGNHQSVAREGGHHRHLPRIAAELVARPGHDAGMHSVVNRDGSRSQVWVQ